MKREFISLGLFCLMGVWAAPALANTYVPLVDSQSKTDAFIPLTPTKVAAPEVTWLDGLAIDFFPPVGPASPLTEVFKTLGSQGLTIISEAPLDGLAYRAGPMNKVSGEVALRMLLTGTDLDYAVDNLHKLVTVRPAVPRSWHLDSPDETTWTALRQEIEARMLVTTQTAATPQNFTMSPSSSSVTVRAPNWVLEDLDNYFKRLNDMLRSDLTFQVEVLQYSGFELPSLNEFARDAQTRFGYSSLGNGLGGVTLRKPVQEGLDPALLLFEFLATRGTAQVVQRPVLTAASGKKAAFKHTNSTSGTFAISLTPRLDPVRSLIRAKLDISQAIGAETTYSGDAVLRPGDSLVLATAVDAVDSQGQRRVTFVVLRSVVQAY